MDAREEAQSKNRQSVRRLAAVDFDSRQIVDSVAKSAGCCEVMAPYPNGPSSAAPQDNNAGAQKSELK